MQQFLVLRVGFGGLSAPLTDEFHACREMTWLNKASPGNAARLTESIAQIDAGEIVEKGLLEE